MTSFLYTEEGTSLSWEKTEQYRFFAFFTFPKFALQHFFRKFPWFVVGHKPVKLKLESRNNTYNSKQMCHSKFLLGCQKKPMCVLS